MGKKRAYSSQRLFSGIIPESTLTDAYYYKQGRVGVGDRWG